MTGHLYITRGLPASGKTTWARGFINSAPVGTAVRLNRDNLRGMMLPSNYREPFFPAEELVTMVQQGQIVELLRKGIDVVIDDTNLRARSVRTFALLAEKAGATWECVDFLDVPIHECLRRDAARGESVGEAVIMRMWRKYLSGGRTLPVPVLEAAVVGKPYVAIEGTPPAILCDVDGTVALHADVRGPYDTSLYHLDKPNKAVIELIQMEIGYGLRPIFCSGRDETFRAVTEEWISQHVLPEWAVVDLFMRPAGDKRNDAIVKLELFDEYIRDHYDVKRIYDDRDRVVAAWRSIGLTVLQVAEGSF